jgi:hypothetical protein
MVIVGGNCMFCLRMEPSSTRERSSLSVDSGGRKSKVASTVAQGDGTAPPLPTQTVVPPSGAIAVRERGMW